MNFEKGSSSQHEGILPTRVSMSYFYKTAKGRNLILMDETQNNFLALTIQTKCQHCGNAYFGVQNIEIKCRFMHCI